MQSVASFSDLESTLSAVAAAFDDTSDRADSSCEARRDHAVPCNAMRCDVLCVWERGKKREEEKERDREWKGGRWEEVGKIEERRGIDGGREGDDRENESENIRKTRYQDP
jgi:hypothetical protein